MSIQSIKADLERIGETFNFEKDSGSGVAKQLQRAAWNGTRRSTSREQNPDGVKWRALSKGYAAKKRLAVGNQPIGVLYGAMLSDSSIQGETRLGVDRMELIAGDTPEAKDELEWFSEGHPPEQPAREVIGLSRETIDECDKICDTSLDKAVNK